MRYQPLLMTALSALLLTACGGEPADTRPGQPVSQRRAAFKKILLAFEPLGIVLREKQYNADQFIAQADLLGKVKDGPWSHFGPDTNYPPTHAKATVWSTTPHSGKGSVDRSPGWRGLVRRWKRKGRTVSRAASSIQAT